MSGPTPTQRAAAIASRQFGVIDVRQAREAGLTDHQVRSLVTRGAWVRRARGIFAVAGAPETPQQRTMVAFRAAKEAGGVVSHLSAAALHGLVDHPRRPHLTVQPGTSAASRLAHLHRSPVPSIDRAHRGPFATTSVSRTLLDCAAVLEGPRLVDLFDEAFCRRLATRASVHTAADRMGPGRPGTRLAREVAEVWSPEITPGSPAELRAMRLLAALGLEGLVAQHEVVDHEGRFVARLDLAVPARRVGFEYDSRRFHGPRRWAHDEARYARLRAIGWNVEPLDKTDLMPGEPRLRCLVEQVCVRTAL